MHCVNYTIPGLVRTHVHYSYFCSVETSKKIEWLVLSGQKILSLDNIYKTVHNGPFAAAQHTADITIWLISTYLLIICVSLICIKSTLRRSFISMILINISSKIFDMAFLHASCFLLKMSWRQWWCMKCKGFIITFCKTIIDPGCLSWNLLIPFFKCLGYRELHTYSWEILLLPNNTGSPTLKTQ